ncbi:MAG: hypothetical protein ACT4RN_13675 [Pseudonocardia sp.]
MFETLTLEDTMSTGNRRTHRVRIVSILALAASAAVLMPAAAHAESKEGCRTYQHRYYLGAGSAITVRVATVDTALKICTDAGGRITGAEATQAVGTTTAGAAAGFNIDAGTSIITRQDAQKAKATYSGRIRVCAATYSPICSTSYPYVIYGENPDGLTTPVADGFIGPVPTGQRMRWSHGPEARGGVHYYERP